MRTSDWIPVSRYELESRVQREVRKQLNALVYPHLAGIERHVQAIEESQTILGERMSSVEDANYARLAELAGLIKAEFASLKEQLDAAVADKDAAVAAGVASAVGEDSAADAERLSGLIAEFEQVLPVPVPEVPVPAPGEPAEVPSDQPPTA